MCLKMGDWESLDSDFLRDFVHEDCGEGPETCCYKFYDVTLLGDAYADLPVVKKIMIECAVRKSRRRDEDEESGGDASVWKTTAGAILSGSDPSSPILFHPGRVVLQDFTGVAALVDLAGLRDRMADRGSDPAKVDSVCPADLVVDNFAQVDFSHVKAAAAAAAARDHRGDGRLTADMEGVSLGPSSSSILHSTFPPIQCSHQQPFAAAPFYSPGFPFQGGPAGLPPTAPYPGVPGVPPNVPSVPERVDGATKLVVAPVPTDNPGLPVQDTVCPFHQHMSYWADQLDKNRKAEMEKNEERFKFLKWVDAVFKNITVIPPGTGSYHKLNLEYLARVVTGQNSLLFPDSVVGTDTHTTMVNGVGVLGWTVGTLETEAVMFGHPLSIPKVPRVVGVKLTGKPTAFATSTDVVMLVTKKLRRFNQEWSSDGQVFVEFFGPGVSELSIADRSSISNLSSEFGAQVAYFPVDGEVMKYLRQMGRSDHQLSIVESYLKAVKMFRDDAVKLKYDGLVEIDLADVQVSVSGPKKVKDRNILQSLGDNFKRTLSEDFRIPPDRMAAAINIDIDGRLHTVHHGTILVASIASCTNTSNPTVMLTAGLLAKKAVERGLSVPRYIKTSLAPGSGVVTSYLRESGVMPYLYMLGFEVVGYGCQKCQENSDNWSVPGLPEVIKQNGIVCCGVLAGNRNYEGRSESEVMANFLTSAPLVIAFSLAGNIGIDFQKTPLDKEKGIYLSDIWPSRKEVQEVEGSTVIPEVFRKLRQNLTREWAALRVPQGMRFSWNPKSTTIKPPKYVKDLIDLKKLTSFAELRCLVKLGHNVTSDHISPAGSIVRNSPAANILAAQGLAPRQFSSYGSRRGNWEVMTAGTFSHLKLKNLMTSKSGPYTVHHPSKVPTTILDAANRYKEEDRVNGLIVVAGENFGRGAPRDWATKGPLSLGVRVVLAVSYDQSYRASLFKTGILPLEIPIKEWEVISGNEIFHVNLIDDEEKPLQPKEDLGVVCVDEKGTKKREFTAKLGLYDEYEVNVFRNGGVMRDMFRKMSAN